MPERWAREVESIVGRVPHQRDASTRFVVAIAGPPAAGKSTFAEELRARLEPRAVVLGMDAFHFDDAILIDRGDRARKGAPHTFDVSAYQLTLEALRNDPHLEISIPAFDRSLELSRNCAQLVTTAHQVVITEGNYLLLDAEPWRSVAELCDLSIMLRAPEVEIERRIHERWRSQGLPDEEARARADRNDLLNARVVLDGSVAADFEFRS